MRSSLTKVANPLRQFSTWRARTIGAALAGTITMAAAIVAYAQEGGPPPGLRPCDASCLPPPPLPASDSGSVRRLAGIPSEVVGGWVDGNAESARFFSPESVAIDAAGNLFIADLANHVIRRISKDGQVTTVAGSGVPGYRDGAPMQAQFNAPAALAFGPDGSLIVSDAGNNCIRAILPTGLVTTLAGAPVGPVDDVDQAPAHRKTIPSPIAGFADGPTSVARFDGPVGLAVDPAGDIFVADKGNHRIRRISDGEVTTFAGSGKRGVQDGTRASAEFSFPTGLALGVDGSLFVTDQDVGTVRAIGAVGVTTIVPRGILLYPAGLIVTRTGDLLVADVGHNQVHRISLDGTVVTLAGTGPQGARDGRTISATLFNPTGLAETSTGEIVIADSGSNSIRILEVD